MTCSSTKFVVPPSTRIEVAAAFVSANAPAEANFNGFPLVAYPGDSAADVERRWDSIRVKDRGYGPMPGASPRKCSESVRPDSPPRDSLQPKSLTCTTMDDDTGLGTRIVHGLQLPVVRTDETISGESFRQYVLFGVHFVRCRLVDCDFSGADLRGCSFVDCNISQSRFCGADLAGAYLHGSTLTTVDFTDARLVGCEFSRNRLSEVTPASLLQMPDCYRNDRADDEAPDS